MKPPPEKYGAWSMFLPELGKVVIAGHGILSQAEFDQRLSIVGAQNVTMADGRRLAAEHLKHGLHQRRAAPRLCLAALRRHEDGGPRRLRHLLRQQLALPNG